MPELFSLCLATLPAVTPGTVATAWSFAPQTALPLAALLALFAARRGVLPRRAAWWLSGWLLLAIALVSPLCRLGASLAAAHMAQHVILVVLAPLCLALGRAGGARDRRWAPLLWALTVGYGMAIWIWHAPAFYARVLLDPVLHTFAYAALAAVAYAFWCALLDAAEAGASTAAAAALAATLLHTGALGALLTFAPAPWYPVLAGRSWAWGLSPLEDQQLAGLVMWVPMGAIYAAAALRLLARDLSRPAAALSP